MSLFAAGGSVGGQEIVFVERSYTGPGRLVQVGRLLGGPDLGAVAPREYLEVAAVGGRPALVMRPIFARHRMAVWMRDEASVWTVSCVGLDQAECVRVAAGAK